MQSEKYNLDGEWPEFQSQNDIFDWLSDERTKAAQCVPRDVSGISPIAVENSSEALSAA